MSKIVIIGAGIGGLATANLLARAGHSVVIYEQSSNPGGRAGLLRADGFTFDTGPSWYLMPEVFDHFYQELGEVLTDHLDIVRLTPSYKVFYEHQSPITITGDLDTDAATFEAIEHGAGKQLRRYAQRAQSLYDLAIRYFLYTNFNRPKNFLNPGILLRLPKMSRMMLTTIHRYVARFVRTTRLQQILEYPMVFLGTSPFEAPALYSLMGALDFNSGVYYPRRGMYSIIESLASLAQGNGVEIRYGTPVMSITSASGRATGVALADGSHVEADIVISNADIHFTETALLAPTDQSFPESYWKKRQASCSALLLYLGIRGSLDELEHHNLFFVDAWRENFEALYHDGKTPEKASLYLSRTSATDPSVAPRDHETLFVLVPLPAGVLLPEANVQAMADHFIAQIEAMTGINLRERIVHQSARTPQDFGTLFHSWRNSMLGPSHMLRQSAFWRTPNKSKRLKNLYYVGAGTTPGVGLPMCLISAQNVVARIAQDRHE